jgi:hypothetical protein
MPSHKRGRLATTTLTMGSLLFSMTASILNWFGETPVPYQVKRLLSIGSVFTALTLNAYAQESLSPTQCGALTRENFTAAVGATVTVTSARAVQPEESWLPEHCLIRATIAPSTGVEIQLPVSQWNERLLFTGCGGLCGLIRTEQGADALARNYAVATTDMGHQLNPGDNPRAWAENEDLVIEWQHRATHRATLLAKAVINAAYGRPQIKAYFRGCSTGGRQGLTEALMYPDDYDGVIAGAPAAQMVTPHNVFAFATSQRDDGSPIFTVDALNTLADAVLEACDMDDGVKDGVLGNPLACTFEPATLQCASGQTASCLTSEQVAAANLVYSGALKDDGTPYYPMGYAKGTERDWIAGFLGSNGRPPRRTGSAQFTVERKIGPGATLADFDYGTHGVNGGPVGGLLEFGADGKRLEPFIRKGGKILMYHGWSDTDATPASSLYFYDAQTEAFGSKRTAEFLRLFFMPGMPHCRGNAGKGVHTADYLTVLERWVEQGEAPEKLEAYKPTDRWTNTNYVPFPLSEEDTVTARTLYPYPAASSYDGSGDKNDPANWRRQD